MLVLWLVCLCVFDLLMFLVFVIVVGYCCLFLCFRGWVLFVCFVFWCLSFLCCLIVGLLLLCVL